MMALMPSCARAFRRGWIQPSREEIDLNYSQDQVLLSPKQDGGKWQGMSLFPRKIALRHAVRNATFSAPVPLDAGTLPSPPENPYQSDTGELLWNTQGIFQVQCPRFVGVTGFLQNFPHSVVGDLLLEGASDFATLTWVSLTEDSLSRTRRSLLTLSTKAQNTDMMWDGIHTLHDHWGGPPTQVFPVQVNLALHILADSIRVFQLDEKGAPRQGFMSYFPDGQSLFHITLDQNRTKTVWFGVEAFGTFSGIKSQSSRENVPSSFKILPAYPNPFKKGREKLAVQYFLPSRASVRIWVVNLLGQTVVVKKIVARQKGWHVFRWNGCSRNFLAEGVYFLRIRARFPNQSLERTQKIILVN